MTYFNEGRLIEIRSGKTTRVLERVSCREVAHNRLKRMVVGDSVGPIVNIKVSTPRVSPTSDHENLINFLFNNDGIFFNKMGVVASINDGGEAFNNQFGVLTINNLSTVSLMAVNMALFIASCNKIPPLTDSKSFSSNLLRLTINNKLLGTMNTQFSSIALITYLYDSVKNGLTIKNVIDRNVELSVPVNGAATYLEYLNSLTPVIRFIEFNLDFFIQRYTKRPLHNVAYHRWVELAMYITTKIMEDKLDEH